MSLTSLLRRDKIIRERFRQEFQKPKLKAKSNLLAPPHTKHYSLVGTAFDYLLRFHVRRLNAEAISRKAWAAEAALNLLSGQSLRRGQEIISQARKQRATYLKAGDVTDELLRSALALARLDPIFRAGRGHEYLDAPIDEKDVEDLRVLLSIIPDEMFTAQNLCLLNPTFGYASGLVGGADADLVIDHTLIDIKTTKYLKLQRRAFNQILGYYILHRLAGVGELILNRK